MEEKSVKAYIVTGFLEAGKTTYIQSFISRDFFHKKEKGKTLILSFESGETEYDRELLLKYRTDVVIWDGTDLKCFIRESVKTSSPDRIFIEDNAMVAGLRELLNEELSVSGTTMLIDATTIELYCRNMTQMMSDMIRISDPVIINRAKNKESLEPYSANFRLLNRSAGFLWESPLGYSEKVFGNALPFDRNKDYIILEEKDFPYWYLDASEFPEFYNGKVIEAIMQIKKDTSLAGEKYTAGRIVMTCCVNDMQFFGFTAVFENEPSPVAEVFYNIKAVIKTQIDKDGKKVPVLLVKIS